MEERTLLEKQLQKEIDRLTRRNRTLQNRVKRLQADNDNLIAEIDILEVDKKFKRSPKKTTIEECPSCQSEIILMDLGINIIKICSSKKCLYRKTLKR